MPLRQRLVADGDQIAQAGAAGAATINVLFMNHFLAIARGHFMLRRLERIHGEEAIRSHYRRLSRGSSAHAT